MKIKLLNTAEGFKCLLDEDFDEKRKLKIGKVYEAEIKQIRNPKFLRKFFALLRCAWEYLNERQQEFFHNNPEKFRETLLLLTGYSESFYDPIRKEWLERAKSISFASMSESEFSDFYERAKDAIYQLIPSINKEEFEEQLQWF